MFNVKEYLNLNKLSQILCKSQFVCYHMCLSSHPPNEKNVEMLEHNVYKLR